jgi:ATP-dependent Lon protease
MFTYTIIIMPKNNKISKEMKINNKKKELERRRKLLDSSDDSDNNSDNDSNSTNSDEKFDVHEYRKMLKELYPSKHMNKKVKSGEKVKKILKDEIKKRKSNKKNKEESDDDITLYSTDDEEEEEIIKKKRSNRKRKYKSDSSDEEDDKHNNKKSRRRKVGEDSEEDENEYDEEDSFIDNDEEDEDNNSSEESSFNDDDESSSSEDNKHRRKNKGKFSIILTVGQNKRRNNNDDEEDEWETCSDEDGTENSSDTENEDDPISSDDDDESVIETRSSKKDKKQEKNRENDKNEEKELLDMLTDLKSKNSNKLIEECIQMCEERLKEYKKKEEKRLKKHKDRNERIFKKILRDKNMMNDFEFYSKLDINKQNKIIKELREINKIVRVEKPYRLSLLESDIPVNFKAAAIKKINSLRHMEPGSGEYYKIKNWVDTFMRIPFGKYNSLPINLDNNSIDNCHDFMETAKKTLDTAVYGLNDAKMQIMQILGQLITNPKAIGTSIAIHGPPGTAKTSIIKEGISKILNRPFAFLALGGATDSSFLEGHSYTYEGSTWGKIVQILIDSQCMNPVIYFDELDKISETPKGEEIAGILTHLTDTTQNSQFHDKYFAEIDFDLSKCLFIFSYNDESKVNPILKDRMYRIQTTGYNQKQKTIITNDYLLPKIRDQVRFNNEDIIIPDQTIHYIIEHFCNKEDGVRNLKRCLEIIHTKLNLYRLMKPGINLFEQDMSIKVQFPFTVTKDIVDKLIKKKDQLNPSLYHLYV